MAYMNFSRPLNVQNLTNRDLLDLIKNNEYYSSCYRIIQEENFEGLDILHLSDNRLAPLRAPQWLSRKLFSLKEALSKNPESLLESLEEENTSDDPRRKISNSLTTIFRKKQNTTSFSKKSSVINKEADIDTMYDGDYLMPNSTKGQKETKMKIAEKLKFPPRNQEVPSVQNRKPKALPRPDSSNDENQYEPPPSHSSKVYRTLSKLPLPLPPPPPEETDEYEPSPRFETKQPESSEQCDYEEIDAKKDGSEGKREKSLTTFYIQNDIPLQLPEVTGSFIKTLSRKISPQPIRSISPVLLDARKNEMRKTRPLPPLPVDTKHQSFKTRTAKNVVEAQDNESDYENTPSRTPETEALPEYGNTTDYTEMSRQTTEFRESEKTPNPNTKAHIDHSRTLPNFKSNIFQKKPFLFNEGSRELQEILEKRNKETNRIPNVKSKKEPLKLPQPPMLLPQNVQNTYFDEQIDEKQNAFNGFVNNSNYSDEDEGSEDLNEYLNIEEIKTKPTSSNVQQNPTSVSQLSLEILKRKLKPTMPKKEFSSIAVQKSDIQVKTSTTGVPSNWKHHDESEESDFEDEQENLNEYLNIEEITKHSSINSQQNSTSVNQLSLEITKKKLKPTMSKLNTQEKPTTTEAPSKWKLHDEFEETDFEDEQDYQPDEYLNVTEAQISQQVQNFDQNIQPTGSDLASQLSKVKLKSTPTKEINLNDSLADELRVLLERKRKEQNGNTMKIGREIINSYHRLNNQNLKTSNPSTEVMDNDDEDELEQENYDVPGSYNDLLNFNNEPFYRNTDRKGAIVLLNDLENGAFLLRPSRKYFLSMTIKNNGKYFNLGIEKTANNKITCGDGMMKSREFFSLKEFLDYFEYSPILLQGERGLEAVYLKKILPSGRF